ncbi:hypothetical protein PROFUN_13158 [Planoprotostelium fungivorum]|uniref:Uncharacterized protein n=1 Tax=Planoprotostelium fungivorum TaxID=1890364 RepID=A0A2P6N566_9EUKA|nr:hypothetical protein PROFUN_13158 [Planoprotostelium fungivorum]
MSSIEDEKALEDDNTSNAIDDRKRRIEEIRRKKNVIDRQLETICKKKTYRPPKKMKHEPKPPAPLETVVRGCGLKDFVKAKENLRGINQKSPLEKEIDKLVQRGEFELAEILSDKLSEDREEERREEQRSTLASMEAVKKSEGETKGKRKKKIQWGFEIKERWETKGAM